MQAATKIRYVIGILFIAMISACAGPLGQQTAAPGGGTAAPGGGTAAPGGGTGTTGSGSNSQHASTTPKPSHSKVSGAMEPGTQNAVQLGAAFGCTNYCFYFGWVFPGGSIQRQIGIRANNARSATVVAVSTGSQEFVLTSDNCTGRVMNPGDSCTVLVTFSPTTNGLRTASLSVSANPSDLSGGTTLGGVGGRPSVSSPSTHADPTQLATTDGPSAPASESPTPSAAPSTPSDQSS